MQGAAYNKIGASTQFDKAVTGQLPWASLAGAEVTAQRSAAVRAAHAAIDDEETGRVLFTSGSTGVPKGVPLSHRNLRSVGARCSRCNLPRTSLVLHRHGQAGSQPA
ncbi:MULTISPECIES: AMP-binding protein [Cupriavidus]|uniref:AMP-dependent synthetase/ligase domain-containing protein n=1 Tax=Cupriavidus oxalaticus TaxID=96344 RepID=A0A4P7L8A7_9BURK|nr:AMP-binding protein [Cupriavidus oxalaticus]MBF6987834.1 AMP-binding protein [Cupriavidus sp. IK-TO18]QBY49939.1 hypothetical protein E0W60_01565 [Cupriavidus oxalaticus]